MNPSTDKPARPEGRSAAAPPESLARLQKQFADHIRNPDGVAAPDGIEDRRMAIYRRLFFNNLSNLFGKNFSTIRKLLSNEEWKALIRDFMIHHRPTTPLFPEIGREFVRYLAETRTEQHQQPWLAELADWTFLKTGLRTDETDPGALAVTPDGDLLEGLPAPNPTLRMRQYEWPVHEISAEDPDSLPQQPAEKPVLLIAWRRLDDRLGMMRINEVTARLIVLLQEKSLGNGLDCLESIGREMQHPDPRKLIGHGQELLESLRRREVILGTRPSQ